MCCCKKKLADSETFSQVSITDALTNTRMALLRKLKEDTDVAKAWSIEGKLRVELKSKNRCADKGELIIIDL